MEPAPRKLDAVDKWRARVLFRDPLPACDSWVKRMERQMAVLRVSFPFLTEKQLRGKAWTACGLRSLMGELPRSGLPPEVKKEFTKRRKDIKFAAMSPKPKIKKESTAFEKKESKLSTYSCIFEKSADTEILIPQNYIVSKALPQTPLNSLSPVNLLPTNESDTLLINNYELLKKRRETKPKKVNFDNPEYSSLINIITPEISEASWKKGDFRAKYKDLYCSQISKEKTTIVQSLDRYTSETISEYSTAVQPESSKSLSDINVNLVSNHHNDPKSVEQYATLDKSQFCTPSANKIQNSQKPTELLNEDSSSTLFECNLPVSSQTCWSEPILNKKSALFENTPVESTNTKNSTIIFKTFDDVHGTDKSSANSLFQDREYGSTSGESQNSNSISVSQYFSLPSTPQEPLINQPLLSDLCCEYSKACSKEAYKPAPYVNSNNIVRKLKEDFDKIIPPEVSLIQYFEAVGKSFEQIQSEVQGKVNNIILTLEEDESIEVSNISN